MHLLMACHRTIDVYGDRKREYRALANFRLDPDASAMHLDDALGNRQAEASAALPLSHGVVCLFELFENLTLVRRGDAWPGVTHCNRERSICCGCLDRNLSLVGELNGVTDKVEQNLRQSALVAVTYWQVWSDIYCQR